MVFIYVLKQQNNKYYVGKTANPKFRLDTHFKTGGCAWTKKYKPTQIIGLFPDCDVFDEDKYTIKYMKKYGIENVRGGSFCQVSLDRETKKCVERMICGANDGCHFCGEQGHFIRNCPKKKYQKRNKEFLEASKGYESADEVEFEDSDEELTIEQLEEAFDEADKDDGVYEYDGIKYLWETGNGLFEESPHGRCGARDGTFYDSNSCEYWRPIKKNKPKKTKSYSSKGKCRKCGRNGHYTNKCYASRHVKGYAI